MPRLPDWLAWVIIMLVALMATVNFAAPFFMETYEPNEMITGLFATVVTTVFLSRRGNGNGNGNGKSGPLRTGDRE